MKLYRNLLLFIACLFSCLLLEAQVKIERIVPMTTDTSVELELYLSSPRAFSGTLQAQIISCAHGKTVWSGKVCHLSLPANSHHRVQRVKIEGIRAELWSPSAPHLYQVKLTLGKTEGQIRIGFRRFEMKDGNFYLNGHPIFLRGNAINPPGRGIPSDLEESKAFARDYVRFLKGMNINIIRIPNNQNWMEVCDEEGMMVFGGRYGRPYGGTEALPPPSVYESVERYKEVELGPFALHPSTVIYVLSNEMPQRSEPWREFLKNCYDQLIQWDHTRQYIGNTGYGLGRSADVYDVHRYWGWYYNTFLTYLNLRDMDMWQNPGKVQAITFTECVGNYTGTDGAYNLCSRTKQPGSQKCWTGHAPIEEQAEAALQYQARVLKNATEMFRRFRSQNPRLSGVMPFTIMFHNWDGIRSFAEMRPKPAAYQYGISYQPILLSWENWNHNLYAGGSLKVYAHIVNDHDDFAHLKAGAELKWRLCNARKLPVVQGVVTLPQVDYYGTHREELEIALPSHLPTGDYTLIGEVVSEGRSISYNAEEIHICAVDFNQAIRAEIADIAVLSDNTAYALGKYGLKTHLWGKSEREKLIVIGEEEWSVRLGTYTTRLLHLVEKGAKLIVLRQDAHRFSPNWLPCEVELLKESNNSAEYLSPQYAYRDGMNINIERPEHKIFEGIERKDLRLWSDYTGYDERKSGFPAVYPVTAGFSARNADLEKTSILANYSRNLSATALAEFRKGQGSVILCGFDLLGRCGIDPIADRLLLNMLAYASSEETESPYQLVRDAIWWGDYESEHGLVVGANNGLILNPHPIVPTDREAQYPLSVDKRGYQYVLSYGGWNTRPGVQYVPCGRRPFAPYDFTKGGNDVVEPEQEGEGRGYFTASVLPQAREMRTLLANPCEEAIKIEISINGARSQEYTLAPKSETESVLPLPEERNLRIDFRGDRRCVIIMTKFQ